MRPGTFLFLIVMVVLIGLTAVVGNMAYKKATEKPAAVEELVKTIPVHVHQVKDGTVEDVVYSTGAVEAAERVDCYAKIPYPGKLISARVKKGDQVSKDQVLLTVDRDEVGAVYLAYAVKAPASGVVAFIQDEPGSLVSAQQPVATILKLSEVTIKSSLIEADLGRIQEGKSVRIYVDAFPDREFSGTVTKVNTVLDEFSHTAPIEITVSNSDKSLKPGMFARCEIVMHTKSGVPVVPRDVVMRREGKSLVYLLDSDTTDPKKTVLRIFLTAVELGYFDLDQYEVKSGIKTGDLVVDQDLVILKEKTLVSVQNPPEGWEDPTTKNAPDPGKTPDNSPPPKESGPDDKSPEPKTSPAPANP